MGRTPNRAPGPLIEREYILLGTDFNDKSIINGAIKHNSETGFSFTEMGNEKKLGPTNNFIANSLPTLFDGINNGYSVGSIWILSGTQQVYILVNEVSGSSVWKKITGIDDNEHKSLRQLMHFLDDGPGDGFSNNPYKEIYGGLFPSRITWWTDSNKNYKIFQTEITRSGVFPITQSYKIYTSIGTLSSVATDVIYYSGSIEVSRIRYLT